jgi:L-iditol 2-dehydrogenase
MRAAMYYNNRDVRIQEMPTPKIGAQELLVKVMASGICGSDVMEWYRLKRAPLVLGHEISGEVVAAGKEVKGFKVGDRVFVSHHVPCNACYYCLSGHHTCCETLHTTNYDPGGFSEYIRVPAINVARGTFLLPEELSYEKGVFIEPLACVLRAQRLAGLKPRQTVCILGSGVSGLLHLLLAKAKGAGKIIMTDISEARLRKAEKLGADVACNAKSDLVSEIRRVNDKRLADVTIICTSALPAFTQALKSVERAGTVLFFAPTEPGIEFPLVLNEFWRNGITLLSSYGNSPVDAHEAIELLRTKKIPVMELISHRLCLAETSLGFSLVAEAKECLKVIIEPFK